MEFNHDNYRVMIVGRENPHNRYNISNMTLNRSECETDLSVQVNSDLRPNRQCSIEARNRANRLLGFIARSVKSISAEVILKLYLALVRSHLDCVVQFCSPYYRMDIGLLVSAEKDDQKDTGDS